jgi:hypothetical protein
MSNPPSSNYIKVKSRRTLRREIDQGKLVVLKAGSNDIDNQPGTTAIGNPTFNPDGVHQPDTITGNEHSGDTISLHMGGMGIGSVGTPPTHGRAHKTELDGTNQEIITDKFRNRIKSYDEKANSLPHSFIEAGSNDSQPGVTYDSGSNNKQLNRTTGLDPDRLRRYRLRDKSNNQTKE